MCRMLSRRTLCKGGRLLMTPLDKYYCSFEECGFSTDDKEEFKKHIGEHLKNDD